jgi:hypothetical protein
VYTAWASVATFVLRLVSENYQSRLDSYFKDVRDGAKLRVERDAFAGDLETMSRLLATGRHCEAPDVYYGLFKDVAIFCLCKVCHFEFMYQLMGARRQG